jgi:hypothetical protein
MYLATNKRRNDFFQEKKRSTLPGYRWGVGSPFASIFLKGISSEKKEVEEV